MERLTFVKSPKYWNKGRHPTKYTSRKTFQEVVDRLAYYEDMEEQGRLVVLPCKVGDTVYAIRPGCEACQHQLNGSLYFCKHVGNDLCKKYVVVEKPFALCALETFGEKYFMTREEAEQALKGGAE